MNLTDAKRRLLVQAIRLMHADLRYKGCPSHTYGLCSYLFDAFGLLDDGTNIINLALHQLNTYITKQLNGPVYLYSWLWLRNYLDRNIDWHDPKTARKLLRTRIAWAKYMLAQLEN
jgi:hypothetical protein